MTTSNGGRGGGLQDDSTMAPIASTAGRPTAQRW